MYKLKRLKNGLRLLTTPIQGTKTATVLIMVGTGSKYENKKNNGISHFLEHMFFKGTKKRPSSLAISSELDSIGGIYNAFTGKECTGYWVKVEAGKLPIALDVISDILFNSKIEPAEINREKGVIIEEFNMYRDNPLMYLEDLFEKCLYGDQPAGWETIGTKKNILKFRRKDFINYLSSQYRANNMVICLAGDIENKATNLIQKYFKLSKSTKHKNKNRIKEKQISPNVLTFYKKTDQAHLSLGVRAHSLSHKDEFAIRVLAAILGGSMSSRMFTELREKRGLAYYVRTEAEFYTDAGYLTTSAGVPIEKAGQAIQVIQEEYKKVKDKLVDKKELQRVKDLIKGRMTIGLEASDNVAVWFGREAILRKEILTPESYIKKIEGVKVEDLRRVANDIFINKGLNLAVIGPYRDGNIFNKSLKL